MILYLANLRARTAVIRVHTDRIPIQGQYTNILGETFYLNIDYSPLLQRKI
jgi:hypothetical protein